MFMFMLATAVSSTAATQGPAKMEYRGKQYTIVQGICPVCSQWFDMRDLAQVAEHIRDGSKIEVLEGPAPPRDPPVH